MLEIAGARKHFGGVKALDGVSMSVAKGRVHALLGENGAGKSTLLKCLAGAHRLEGGEMRIGGEAYSPQTPHDAEAAGLRFVYQELNLVPGFTAFENAFVGRRYPRRLGMIHWADMSRRMRLVRDRFALDVPLDVPVRRLSIGQRQMVEILRALMDEAQILFLDEPTSSLSESEGRRLLTVARDLAADGRVVVFVSHRMEEVFAVADDYTVLRNGRTVGQGRIPDARPEDLIALMAGEVLRSERPTDAVHVGDVVLRVSELSVGPRRRPVDFTVRQGEIVGLYGIVGSGRSALLRSIWGANPQASGEIVLGGRRLPLRGIGARIRAGAAYVPEDRRSEGLVMQHSLLDNAALPKLGDHRVARGLPVVSWRAMRRSVRQTLARLQVKFGRLSDRISMLSGGNQQKILIGRWFGRKLSLLLLDEPTRGVDVRSKVEIHDLCRSLAGSGAAVAFATSDIEELFVLATRIVVMVQGAIVLEAAATTIDRRDVVGAAFRTPD
jgi:ribose transport system ATP-binding protein